MPPFQKPSRPCAILTSFMVASLNKPGNYLSAPHTMDLDAETRGESCPGYFDMAFGILSYLTPLVRSDLSSSSGILSLCLH